MGITLASLSMLCAVWNDLVFKSVRRDNPVHAGRFVAGIGVIWTLVFALPLLFSDQPSQWQGWFYALLAGGASAAANIMLIDCLARVDVGVGSTVYRLNLVWVMILSFLFLDESLTVAKMAAMTLGLLAILLLSGVSSGLSLKAIVQPAFKVLLLASVLRALMGFFYKLALADGMGQKELLVVSGVCWIVAGVASAWPSRQDGPVIAYSRWVLLSGVLVCGIVFFLSRALACTDASVAVPISQFNFVGTAALGIILFNEPLTLRKGAGLAAACVAVLLLAVG